MEATWTRCLPFASKLQAVLASGAIGEVRAVQSAMCFDWTEIVRQNPDHRLINPNLAGGALLDLSPYSYTILALSILPRSKASPEPLPMPKVVSSAIKTPLGVDASSTTTINFEQPDGRIVPGTMSSAIDRVTPPERCALIQGSLGYITIRTPANVPQSFTVERYGAGHPMWMSDMEHKSTTYDFVMPKGTWGFAYEADEVARCLRDGKKESDIIPLRETILQMQVRRSRAISSFRTLRADACIFCGRGDRSSMRSVDRTISPTPKLSRPSISSSKVGRRQENSIPEQSRRILFAQVPMTPSQLCNKVADFGICD